jgi:hypothetical protein
VLIEARPGVSISTMFCKRCDGHSTSMYRTVSAAS